MKVRRQLEQKRVFINKLFVGSGDGPSELCYFIILVLFVIFNCWLSMR